MWTRCEPTSPSARRQPALPAFGSGSLGSRKSRLRPSLRELPQRVKATNHVGVNDELLKLIEGLEGVRDGQGILGDPDMLGRFWVALQIWAGVVFQYPHLGRLILDRGVAGELVDPVLDCSQPRAEQDRAQGSGPELSAPASGCRLPKAAL